MREILFRGKRKVNAAWVYGFYVEHPIGNDSLYTQIVDKNGWTHDVSQETVGQFTGLLDKNGKKIFEGDILVNQLNSLVDSDPFEVVWSDDCGGFAWKQGDEGDILYPAITRNCEVIGNVHDNPELLEEKI